MVTTFIYSGVTAVVLGLLGWWVSSLTGKGAVVPVRSLTTYFVLGGVVLGLGLPFLLWITNRWLRDQVGKISPQSLYAGMVGLLVSLLVSALLAVPLYLLPGLYGNLVPIATTVVISYFGVNIAVMRLRELSQFFPFSMAGRRTTQASYLSGQLVVDTSTIIDGRIADISRTGFLRSELLIPGFVLNELQHIADSSDPMRRKRGRRGLEMLNKLQKEADVPLQVIDVDFEDVEGVDSKLVKLAKNLHCPIISNDFNLNRVAELQGVMVLNINQLAASLKPIVLPGEEMEIYIAQEGKESGQGVGFMDDGTMVVVDGGKRYVNSQVDIIVTRVLQTAVGRMVFAQMKNGSPRER